MKRVGSLCLAFALTAACPLGGAGVSDLLAQQKPTQHTEGVTSDTISVTRLSAVIVTAPRIGIALRDNPAATSLVGPVTLDAMPRGIAVDEAMRLVPGVKVDNQANGERVHMSIRGQGILSERGIRGIRVTLDGLPLNDPSGFAADFYDVDWATVREIEVMRGPGASLYGGGSSAGVVNIITTDGGPAPVSGLASGTYGSNGFWRTTGEAYGSVPNVDYGASYSHAQGDGYRIHSAFHGDIAHLKAQWTPSSTVRVSPVLWYSGFYNQNAEGLNLALLAQDRTQANPDAVPYNEYQDTRRVMGGFVGRVTLPAEQELSFTGYMRHTRYDESVPSSVQHRRIFAPGGTVQYTVHRSTGPLRHHVSVGTDLQLQTIDEYRHPNLGDAVEGTDLLSDERLNQAGIGVFALDKIDLSEQWTAMLNVRYDRIHNGLTDNLQAGGIDLSGNADFDRVTGRVGLTYSPSATLNLYATVGQGFLPPATEELANNPAQFGGFNEGLRAATSLGEEVGVRSVLGGHALFDVTVFHLDTDGDFDRYRVASRPLETFYRNAGSSRRFGVESYLRWSPVRPVLVQVAYTFSHFKYTNSTSAYGDVDGHWLPNSPEHQLVVDGEVSPVRAFSLGAGVEALSRWYVDPSNVASVTGYALLNARAAYRVPLRSGVGAQITFAVRNILNKEYIAFTEPDPDGNSYQPAATREFFAGMRLTR